MKKILLILHAGLLLLSMPVGVISANGKLTEDEVKNRYENLAQERTQIENDVSEKTYDTCQDLGTLINYLNQINKFRAILSGLKEWNAEYPVERLYTREAKDIQSLESLITNKIKSTITTIAIDYTARLNNATTAQKPTIVQTIYNCFIVRKLLADNRIKRAVVLDEEVMTALQELVYALPQDNARAQQLIGHLNLELGLRLSPPSKLSPTPTTKREQTEEKHAGPERRKKEAEEMAKELERLMKKPSISATLSLKTIKETINKLLDKDRVDIRFEPIEQTIEDAQSSLSENEYITLTYDMIAEKLRLIAIDIDLTTKNILRDYIYLTQTEHGKMSKLFSYAQAFAKHTTEVLVDLINRLETNYTIASPLTQQVLTDNRVLLDLPQDMQRSLVRNKQSLFKNSTALKNMLEDEREQLIKYAENNTKNPEVQQLLQALEQLTDALSTYIAVFRELNLLPNK